MQDRPFPMRFGGKSPWLYALLAFPAWPAAIAQQPVMQVSPAATPVVATAASPTPHLPPIATGATPALMVPALTGTAPALTGTVPALTGTTSKIAAAAPAPSPPPPNPYSIEIDLEHQRAYLLKNGRKFAEAPVSSGRAGHLTPTGNFSVIQKDLNHVSTLYGKFVDIDSGRVVKEGADSAMPVPKGCKFVPAPMKWFMRFDGASGMHAGFLPGYPASHGCVRMPASKAELFFETVEVGTPVHVFGDPPLRDTDEPSRTASAPKATPSPAPQKPRWWLAQSAPVAPWNRWLRR